MSRQSVPTITPDERTSSTRRFRGADARGCREAWCLMMGAAMIGLTGFGTRVSRQDHELALADNPGTGIVVRTEVLRVWLPNAMIELANTPARSWTLRSQADLRRVLETRGQAELWYVVTIRGHRADGNYDDLQFVRQPYREPEISPQFLEILDRAAADAPALPADDFSTPLIRVLPEAVARLLPRDVLFLMQTHPDLFEDFTERGVLVPSRPRGEPPRRSG